MVESFSVASNFVQPKFSQLVLDLVKMYSQLFLLLDCFTLYNSSLFIIHTVPSVPKSEGGGGSWYKSMMRSMLANDDSDEGE